MLWLRLGDRLLFGAGLLQMRQPNLLPQAEFVGSDERGLVALVGPVFPAPGIGGALFSGSHFVL